MNVHREFERCINKVIVNNESKNMPVTCFPLSKQGTGYIYYYFFFIVKYYFANTVFGFPVECT